MISDNQSVIFQSKQIEVKNKNNNLVHEMLSLWNVHMHLNGSKILQTKEYLDSVFRTNLLNKY